MAPKGRFFAFKAILLQLLIILEIGASVQSEINNHYVKGELFEKTCFECVDRTQEVRLRSKDRVWKNLFADCADRQNPPPVRVHPEKPMVIEANITK